MAVYTPLSEDEVAQFLQQYDAGTLVSVKGIAEGIENTNYLIYAQREGIQCRYILTIYEHRTNPAELPFFLGLTEWLADRGVSCPRPVHGKDGHTVYTIKNKSAALIRFLAGRGNPHITPRHLELTGGMIAQMHLASQGFPLTRRNALSLDGWQAMFTRIADRVDEIAPGLFIMIENELAYLREHWPRELPWGIIHADIFPDNVFFIDGHTDYPELSGVIDFYFACNDFWMYDVVICMNAWCFGPAQHFMPDCASALLKAYDRLRPMTKEEKKSIPVLARGASLRFLLTRAHDWLFRVEDALVTPKDPIEYANKLYFHQQVRSYQDYGLSDE